MKTLSEIESKIVEHYEKIQDFAQKEINRTFTVYKFLFWAIAILLTSGITIGTILIGKSLSDIESKYETKYQESFENARQTIRKEIEYELIKAKEDVSERIEYEFDADNIKKLVETNAQKRIDFIADKLIAIQIENKISPIKDNLKTIETNTNNNIDKLIFDYYELGVYNDSKKAFIGLYNTSLDNSNIYQKKAQEIIDTKISDLEVFFKRKFGEFGSIIDINISDFDELYKKYKTELSLESRFYFLEDFWQNSNHDKKSKLNLLIKIFKDEIGLKSSYFIGKILINEYNLPIKPCDFINIQNELDKKH